MATKKETVKIEEKVEKIKLNPIVWEVPYNADLISQVLLVMRSNKRLGTAHAKTRAMVSGGGKKPWKQKGTGRARVGSNRSPLWVKGGVTFVPNNRNWERKINKKMRKLAIRILLSERLKKEVLEFVKIANKEKLSDVRKLVSKELILGKYNLVVTDRADVKRAMSNVEKVFVVAPKDINVMNLAIAKKIIVDDTVVNVIESNLTNEK